MTRLPGHGLGKAACFEGSSSAVVVADLKSAIIALDDR